MCGLKTTDTTSLNKHVRDFHGTPNFHCPVCSKSYENLTSLTNHLGKHSEVEVQKAEREVLKQRKATGCLYYCSWCGTGFMLVKSISEHIKAKHQIQENVEIARYTSNVTKIKLEEPVFNCNHCQRTFQKSYQFFYHLNEHKNVSNFSCPNCKKAFSTKLKLTTHYSRCHDKRISTYYQCETCEKILGSKQGLLTHRKRHLKLYNVKCEFCGKGFFCSGSLRLHVNSKHTGKSNFVCDICNRACYDKTALKNHMEKHRPEYKTKSKVICKLCNQQFLDEKYLKIHLKSKHMSDNGFVCDLCGKKLYSKSGLKDHQNIHQGLKPYKCEFCGVGFANSTTLKLHCRRHTGEKPYKCTLCTRAFTQSHSLKVHLRLHTGEKPFICNVCEKGFVSTSVLRAHMKSNHKLD
ncbi:hypothetical protein ABEB36_001377 [Hypothenemus hampei]|uniref:C2H2-type domain-containing protein n=1 Tax=Hypothenemus hampei TaxID=57062 RepID=A0ABD1FED5_HYPHA